MPTAYTLSVHLDTDPVTAEQRVRDALAAEGFGVLIDIDLQATLKDKLDVEGPPYTILGACNPPLAHQALAADPDIGTLLPCNVVVRAAEAGGIDVVAADPRAMLALSDADGLRPVAVDAAARLERALRALG